jgi:hypothetical protein
VQTIVCIPTLPDSYPESLESLKREIGAARTRAALAVNQELIGLYWRIGREILARQEREVGARRSSTGSPPTFGRSSRR